MFRETLISLVWFCLFSEKCYNHYQTYYCLLLFPGGETNAKERTCRRSFVIFISYLIRFSPRLRPGVMPSNRRNVLLGDSEGLDFSRIFSSSSLSSLTIAKKSIMVSLIS